MKTTFYFLAIAFLTLLVSCKEDTNLVEVKIPEPEVKVSHEFSNPNDYKATGKPFKLYALPFRFDSISQPIGGKNLEYHYAKVYLNYANKLNTLIEEKQWTDKTITQICTEVKAEDVALKNNAGGFYNHTLYFEILTPKLNTQPSDTLKTALVDAFGSVANFKTSFTKTALSSFGSSWVWLLVTKNKKLEIVTTTNENNPLMVDATSKGKPLIALDVWEHAYLNNYQNNKKEYIDCFLKHLNWDLISERYQNLIE